MFFNFFKVNDKGSDCATLYDYFSTMDNVLNTSDVDLDYILIYKDRDLILKDIGFENEDDKLICEAIVDNLEQKAAKHIKNGDTVSIPFIGTIERNWYKQSIRDKAKEFKEFKNSHTESEYKEYFKTACTNIINNHNEEVDKLKREKRFKKLLLPKYINYCKKRSVIYANAWIKMVSLMKVVEFDPDIEDIYERFGFRLDAND